MSSPPAEATPARRRKPFEPWRKVMLAGALLLWSFYVGVAITKTQPSEWLMFPVNFTGYGLLSVGFVLRMRDRRRAQEAADAATAEKATGQGKTGSAEK